MSFEVLAPGTFGPREPLEEGFGRFSLSGTVAIRQVDLDLIGVKDSVVILVDSTTKRIALQRPNPEQADVARKVGCVGKTVRHVTIGSALGRCGIRVKDFAPCLVELHCKDDRLLILNLADHKPLARVKRGAR